jgi:hypothetical protein
MSELDWTGDRPRDGDYLADYRRAVEQLRGETVAELGRQPMPPEALSAIALAVASLPLAALILPPVPVEPQVWQVGLALLVVWLAAFRIQSARYARFHEHWRRKVVRLAAVSAGPGAEDLRFLGAH